MITTTIPRTILAAALFTAAVAEAQTPIRDKYIFTQESLTYEPLAKPTVLATGTGLIGPDLIDGRRYDIDLPFEFNFNGKNFNKVQLNSYGYIVFNPKNPKSFPNPFNVKYYSTGTNGYTDEGVFSALATNLGIISSNPENRAYPDTSNTTLSYEVRGEEGRREIVFQWYNFQLYYFNRSKAYDQLDFQIILSEDGSLKSVYNIRSKQVDGDVRFWVGIGAPSVANEGRTDYSMRISEGNANSNWLTTTESHEPKVISQYQSDYIGIKYSLDALPPSGLSYTFTPKDDALGTIESTKKPAVKIAPNPASEIITIKADGFKLAELIDLNGRKIIESQKPNIYVKGLKPGVYLLKIVTSTEIISEKVIVK